MAFLFGQGFYGNYAKTSGGLANMSINGTQCGFLKGIKPTYNNKPLDFMVGTPAQFAGRMVVEYQQGVTGQYAEVDALQASLNLGSGLAGFVTVAPGTSVISPSTITWSTVNGQTGLHLLGGGVTIPLLEAPAAFSISAGVTADAGSSVEFTTAAPHGIIVGQTVVLSSMSVGGYNGTYVVT